MEKTDFKILLVDDEPDILEFVGYNIKKEGYALLTASNGRDAIQIAKKEIPDLIVLDIMMPGGGYVAGASHDSILEETPVENIVAIRRFTNKL